MIIKKTKLFKITFLILLSGLLASCMNSQKEEVHKHEVEIKPIKVDVKVDVDIKVTQEKETEEKTKNED